MKIKNKNGIIQINMNHATMFSYRHSLNGSEAAVHLQGWTSEHYTSSAQLYEGRHSEVMY